MNQAVKQSNKESQSEAKADLSPGSLPQTGKLPSMQAAAGNLAVQRTYRRHYIQPKLNVSDPDDPAEREADAIAKQFMRMPANAIHPTIHLMSTSVQRMCSECDEELKERASETKSPSVQHETEQDKENNTPIGLQKNLSLSQAGDANEVESEHLADSYLNSRNIRQEIPMDDDNSQRVQRKTADGAASHSAGEIGTTRGQALSASVRQPFEHFFNTDLSKVQIATDDEANQSAQSLNARAYTHGNQVVFAAGEYKPHSQKGQKLLAHELAHVVQQRRAPVDQIARQPGHSTNPVLTPHEMFNSSLTVTP
jgi:Domain of unknown function (DUF4157)